MNDPKCRITSASTRRITFLSLPDITFLKPLRRLLYYRFGITLCESCIFPVFIRSGQSFFASVVGRKEQIFVHYHCWFCSSDTTIDKDCLYQ